MVLKKYKNEINLHFNRVRVCYANGKGRHDWDWRRVEGKGIFYTE